MAEQVTIAPQPGPQEQFLSSPADLVIFGGAAGGGKSFALLLDAARHMDNPDYGAVIFRRTHPQIVNQGGLWDTSQSIYPLLGARSRGHNEWKWPSGATVGFRHLQHEKSKYDWQGAQIPFIGFDELTHFSWGQFTYMLSRSRSTCGIKPVIRGTTNPDPDHWLRRFLAWWIDEDTGYPIQERAGVLRWMVVQGGEVIWGDSREEMEERFGADADPLSVTFVPSLLEDNPALEKVDPTYRNKLKAMPPHERAQLLEGNWNARPATGAYFQRHWFRMVDAAPADVTWVRYWDRAGTEPNPENPDPDWTVGALVGMTRDGYTIIGDIVRFRGTPGAVERAITNTASQDGFITQIGLEQEPGASGKSEGQYLVRQLGGYAVTLYPAQHNKEVNWKPLSSQAEAGNVMVVKGAWNEALFSELEAVPEGHDDQADAVSGGYNMLYDLIIRQGLPAASWL